MTWIAKNGFLTMACFTTTKDVDLIVLSRDQRPLPAAVRRGLEGQQDVRVRIHSVIGAPRPADTCRWDAIVRARNQGKRLGHARWLMFVDDVVALDAHCVAELVRCLHRQPVFGALAANYLGEGAAGVATHHVGMGARLFRRAALDQITFRWEPGKCHVILSERAHCEAGSATEESARELRSNQ